MAWRSFIVPFLARASAVPVLLRRFAGEQSGAVVLLFGLALIPVAGLMGLALDYSRGQLAREQLQNAVDSAGLAVAQMPRDTPIATIQAEAKKWIDASLASKGVDQKTRETLSIVATRKPDNSGYTFRAELDTGLTLFNVSAKHENPEADPKMRVAANNEVDWSLGIVEIALVLDNTGSMLTNDRIGKLRKATTNLVKLLKDAAKKPGQVKISLVPFSQVVRLDPAYQSKPWIDKGLSPVNREIFWSADPAKASPNRFSLLAALGVSWRGCVEVRPQPYDVQETAADVDYPETLFVPHFAPDEPDEPGEDSDEQEYDNDYLKDDISDPDWKKLQGNVNKYKASNKKGGSYSTSYGPNFGCNLQRVIPLTDVLKPEFQDLETAITNMVASGYTNIPLGMAWGWHTLSPLGPFEDKNGAPYDTQHLTKFVILMTDGENTFIDPHNCKTVSNSINENKNRSIYQALGYAWQNRLQLGTPLNSPYGCQPTMDKGARSTAMDNRLKLLCANMKQPFDPKQPKRSKVHVFTVGVELDEDAEETLDMLRECASEGSFYAVDDASQMNAVFQKIGEEIRQLRLAK